MIHVINLDGAKDGEFKNKEVITKILETSTVPVQVGGGIRSLETIEYLISQTTKYVILGTGAINDQNFLKKAIKNYPDNITVSIDVKNKKIVTEGWLVETSGEIVQTFKELEKLGVKRFIYTDTIRDGTLTSPNFKEIQKIRDSIKAELIIAGGICSVEHIKQLEGMDINGAIIGTAMFEGNIDLNN